MILFAIENVSAQDDRYLLSDSRNRTVYKYHSYSLLYDEATEQAAYVAYELTRAEVSGEYERPNISFRTDSKIKTGSATSDDYYKTGFDRGHLVPAADLRHSRIALTQSFLMSNISPQLPKFNRGIWAKLEKQIRNYALQRDTIYVFSGPIFIDDGTLITIGENKVRVPVAFFKILFDPENRNCIGYLIPQAGDHGHLSAYWVTVDEIEGWTGLNFFSGEPDENVLDHNIRWD